MDDGRKKDDQRKPGWSERSVPEVYRPGPTRPLSADDDGLFPAADPIVQAAYRRSGTMPSRPVMNRGDDGTDALVIRRSAKQTRVLSFEVEGIHWKAGFAPEIGHTPISQYVPNTQPPEAELLTGNGFILRPIEPELEAVLRDIAPGRLLLQEEAMFGKLRELGGVYLYFVPQPVGATVGMLAWYLPSAAGKTHMLYLQTEIKRAEPRILDDMHKTFRASLAARQQNGGAVSPLNLWEELQLATTQVEATLKNSTFARNSAEVKGLMAAARLQAENGLDRGLRKGMGAASVWLRLLFVELPQVALAMLIRTTSRALIAVVKRLDQMAVKHDDR